MRFDTGTLESGAYVRLYSTDTDRIRLAVGYSASQSSALDTKLTLHEARLLQVALTAFMAAAELS